MEAPVNALLIEGVAIMLIGMTIVFAFLLVLVGGSMAMSWAVRRWGPAEALAPAGPLVPPPTAPARPGEDAALAAAITAAVHAYRRRSQP